jgi:hypothetical protein
VPTPSYPELAEASDEAFTTLERVTAPRTVTERKRVELIPSIGGCGALESTPGDVTVLQEKRVAGYDAAVLEAKSADALSEWLSENGYEFARDLKEWVDPYLQKGWKVTAFKVARDRSGNRLATSAVRMTFATEKAFFPYREPHGQPQNHSRRLRVYFLADARYEGVLQDGRWHARVPWANVVDDASRTAVLEQLKLSADVVPPKWWLTEFEDTSSPRPGHDDVTFQPEPVQQTAERQPHVVYVEPTLLDYPLAFLTQCGCCYGPFLLLGVVVWWHRRQKHQRPH